jgi:hypothetical protein
MRDLLTTGLTQAVERCLAAGDTPRRILRSAALVAILHRNEPGADRLVERVRKYLRQNLSGEFSGCRR